MQRKGAPVWAELVTSAVDVADLTKEIKKKLEMEKERLGTITLRVVTGKDSLSPQLDSTDTVEEALGPIKSGDKVRIVVDVAGPAPPGGASASATRAVFCLCFRIWPTNFGHCGVVLLQIRQVAVKPLQI